MTGNRHPIAAAFLGALAGRSPLAAAQDRLLEAAGARATGLWRLSAASLDLLGFRAVPDMPPEVAAAFAAATARLPLDRTDLGVVKAAVTGRAVAAVVAAGGGTGEPLGGSAAWLARFAARQSLAVPAMVAGRVAGVIAVSAAEPFAPGSAPWALLETIAAALGPALAAAGGPPAPPGPAARKS